MNWNQNSTVLFFTALATALAAGVFFTWTFSVTLGLGKLSDKEYLLAFQSLNREIQNPVFFSAFFGTAVLLPLSTYLNFRIAVSPLFYCLLAASLLYWVGVMGVTIFGNIPLNEALDSFNTTQASLSDISEKRLSFENKWNFLNSIRTVTSIISLGLVLWGCIAKK